MDAGKTKSTLPINSMLQRDPASQQDFENLCIQNEWKPIYHVTDHSSAAKIIAKKSIYGVEANAAHFHNSPGLARKQAQGKEVVLGFAWSGEVLGVELMKACLGQLEKTENVLFDIPIAEISNDTWELRLYPGTNRHLELLYVQTDTQSVLLRDSMPFEVIAAT